MIARTLHNIPGPPLYSTAPAIAPTIPEVSLLQHLFDFSGGRFSQFASPHQAQALQAIRERSENLCVVLPTGMGKSLLWMLPAATFEKSFTSIIVVPFRALLEDFKRNCQINKVVFQEWNSNNHMPMAPVVFVALEHLRDPAFQSFATRLSTLRRLARIVLEEGHVALTSGHFRNTASFASLFLLPTQIVLLSATVPPTALPILERILGMQRPFQVIRTSTCRTNIKIRPHLLNSVKECDKATVDTITAHLPRFGPDDRFLVFTRTLAKTKKLAKALCVPFYDRDLTPAQKKTVLLQFVNGEVQGVVATTAFGQGINVPGVRVVVINELAYSGLDLSQQLGRGGRDGE
ncbi:P-loop containing nucleoside triphosphate hydrolase protein, partial [Ramaria rubella]